MLLKNYKQQNTLGIVGLSTQLCTEAVKLGFLVRVQSDRIITDNDSLVHLYLQPAAAKALLLVAKETTVVISTAYRTLAQQYVLKHNLPGLVATIGNSDHGAGRSIDATNYQSISRVLVKHKWQQTYANTEDKVHWDFPGEDNRALTVKAFQSLYNRNNSDKLLVDGGCGPKTLLALANAPICGWPEADSSRIPLMPGQIGKDVGRLQLKLRELGYFKGAADNVFREDLKLAVIEYQSARKFTADGIPGGITLSSLALI